MGQRTALPYVERLIGSIRRELLDHVLVLGEGHLHRLLAAYFDYYQSFRTHLSLGKDAPDPRDVQVASFPETAAPQSGLGFWMWPNTSGPALLEPRFQSPPTQSAEGHLRSSWFPWWQQDEQ